jgi:hypothetical protein
VTASINGEMPSSGDFHQARKTWSRIKHSILGRYLSLLLGKLGRPGEHVFYVDGFAGQGRHLVTRSLELIRDNSTLNVRVLTRSPLARLDFELFKSFGHRLVFGMSLPTLSDDLARVYEPKAPAPSLRLATLLAAKDAGLHVYSTHLPKTTAYRGGCTSGQIRHSVRKHR